MKISSWKKTAAWGLAFAMAMSLSACGGSKEGNANSDSSNKTNSETKNMVFAGEQIDMKDVKGDPGNFIISGDKIYFFATEWPDIPKETASEDGNKDSDTANDVTDDTASESLENVATDDAAVEESATEETGSEEQVTEEDVSGDSSKEQTSEEADTKAEDEGSEENSDSAEVIDENYDYYGITRIYSMNLDGTGITEICEPDLENKQEYIQYMIIDKDKKITLFTTFYGEEENSQRYYLSKLDESGKVAEHIDLSKAIDNDPETYISKVLSDDKGNYVVITDQGVLILDSNYNKVAAIKDDNNWIEASAKTQDGKIICGITGEDGSVVREVDIDNKKFGEPIKIDLQYFNGSDSLMAGSGDYDFFYKSDSGVYGYKDNTSTKLLDFLASEINSNNTYGIIAIDSETMIGMSWDGSEESYGATFTLYKKVDPSQVKDKITITYGALWGVNDTVKNAAIKFNKENDKYRIEFKDYGDSEDAQTKMNADIMAGNVPDIIDLSYLPVGQYVTKGILEDLTPYLEKDDEVKKEDILPSVEKAMEIDGKIYYVASSFMVRSLVATKKDVGDKMGWTFDELKALLDEKGDDVRPFYTENKADIMNTFLYACIDDYIDWTTGECRFDSDDFKSILEIAGRGTDEEMDYNEDAPSQPELIKSGKVLFSDGYIDTENVQLYKKMYNTDIAFIGYPCEDKQGSYFSFESQMGIYSKSDVKDGAWEFIHTFMTKDYQANGGNIWNIPTNKDAFEMYMKTKTATKAYKDEYGNEIEPVESSWGWDDLEVNIGPLSSEEEKLFRGLVDNTTKVSSDNEQVMTIIDEEAANYFKGQKSLDETAEIIQNRITTYVNENR